MTQQTSNQFMSTLQRHRSGGLLADASAKLSELVQAVHATGRKGSITIKISVVPASAGKTLVSFCDEISAKIPRPQIPMSVWFTTPQGELVKNDPDQQEMQPIVAVAEAAPVVEKPLAIAVNA